MKQKIKTFISKHRYTSLLVALIMLVIIAYVMGISSFLFFPIRYDSQALALTANYPLTNPASQTLQKNFTGESVYLDLGTPSIVIDVAGEYRVTTTGTPGTSDTLTIKCKISNPLNNVVSEDLTLLTLTSTSFNLSAWTSQTPLYVATSLDIVGDNQLVLPNTSFNFYSVYTTDSTSSVTAYNFENSYMFDIRLIAGNTKLQRLYYGNGVALNNITAYYTSISGASPGVGQAKQVYFGVLQTADTYGNEYPSYFSKLIDTSDLENLSFYTSSGGRYIENRACLDGLEPAQYVSTTSFIPSVIAYPFDYLPSAASPGTDNNCFTMVYGFNGFMVYNTDNQPVTSIPDDSTIPYKTCNGAFDLPCQISNGVTYLIYESTLVSPVVNLINNTKTVFINVINFIQSMNGFGLLFALFCLILLLCLLFRLVG